MHCSACDTWSTRADRCSYCGAVPAAAAPQQPGAGPAPVLTGSPAAPPVAVPAAAMPPDPYAAPAPAPTGGYPGAYPHAPGQFAPQPPYGMPGPYPGSPYPGWLPQPFRALRGLAVTLYILLPLSAVFAGLCAAAFFHRADVLRQIVDAGEFGMTDSLRTRAEDSDALVAAAITFLVLAMIATAVLFVIWMYRARANVDLFGPSKQHLSTGWAIGGWLVPVVNLWFPKLILHDVWRASDPRTAERGGRTPGRLPLLWAWWVLLIGSTVLFFASRLSYPLSDDIELSDADRLQTIDILSGAADIVLILAAVAAVLVVRRITTFQHEREALAFASGVATGGVPAGPPAPWAAYPAAAPTGQYFAPPMPLAPQAPMGGQVAPAEPVAAAAVAQFGQGATTAPPPRPVAAPTAGMAAAAAEPAEPVSLAKPAEPAASTDAAAPAAPAAPAAAVVPTGVGGSAEPAGPVEPAPAVGHAAESPESAASVELGKRVEAAPEVVDTAESAESPEPGGHTELGKPAEAPKPVEAAAESTEPAEAAKPADVAAGLPGADAAEPAGPAEPFEGDQPDKAAEAVTGIPATDAAGPAAPAPGAADVAASREVGKSGEVATDLPQVPAQADAAVDAGAKPASTGEQRA
ncbi:DUF4328 domain-containing protein [Embleya sp. AB8]|uniref:DUF4328 domain-containing protein n=1 Tax=Embleya sp. AB8 TaxID=3156304 RepID=UPI003C72E2E3